MCYSPWVCVTLAALMYKPPDTALVVYSDKYDHSFVEDGPPGSVPVDMSFAETNSAHARAGSQTPANQGPTN